MNKRQISEGLSKYEISLAERQVAEFAFTEGVKWGEKNIIERLHKALKGLGLEKHSIALNVLKIAGIELPKTNNDTTYRD